MHGLFAGGAEQVAHLDRPLALHEPQLVGRERRDALADRRAVADDVDGVAGVERPAHLDDADRQQRRPALAQRPRRAGVDDDPSRARAWRTSARA